LPDDPSRYRSEASIHIYGLVPSELAASARAILAGLSARRLHSAGVSSGAIRRAQEALMPVSHTPDAGYKKDDCRCGMNKIADSMAVASEKTVPRGGGRRAEVTSQLS